MLVILTPYICNILPVVSCSSCGYSRAKTQRHFANLNTGAVLGYI